MIARRPPTVARPLRPVIGGRREVGKAQSRRGAPLVWRSRARRPHVRVKLPASQPKWALTMNLFVRALLGLREVQMRPSGGSAAERLPLRLNARLSAPVQASSFATLIETLATKTILQRIWLPGMSSLEIMRRTVPKLLVSAIREPVRLVRELSWAPQRVRREVLQGRVQWRLARGLAVPASSLAFRLARAQTDHAERAPMMRRESRVLPGPMSRGRERRLEVGTRVVARTSVAAPGRQLLARRAFTWARSRAVPVLAQTGGPSREFIGVKRRERGPVRLEWPSRGEGTAASVSMFPASQPRGNAPSTAGVDLTPVSSSVAVPQPEPPNVDRLVDEVLRRLDRQYRIERMKRGL